MSKVIDLSGIYRHMNKKFYPLLFDESRYLVLKGGMGSGKSHLCAQKILVRIASDWNNVRHRFLVLRKTLPAARESTYKLLKDYVNNWHFDSLVSSMTVNPLNINFTNGSEILIRSLDDPDKIKSIEGITSCWMEEATEFVQDDFDEIDRRIRGDTGTYKQIMVSFNPTSKLKWVYDTFFENPLPSTTTHHSTFKDNRFILTDEAYMQVLENYAQHPDSYKYKVYYLGDWGVLEGLIFNNFHEVKEFPVCDQTAWGVDFGFGAPTSVLKCGVKKVSEPHEFGEMDLYSECVLYNSDISNNELIQWLIGKLPSGVEIYCDSAEPARIDDMISNGLNARPANKEKGSVFSGIDWIKDKKWYIVNKNTTNEYLMNELLSYSYGRDREGRSTEKPADKQMDHAIDAARYAFFTKWAIPSRVPKMRKVNMRGI